MYTPDLDNHVNLIKIGPDFELKVDELIEANCTLMLIIKSKILEVKRILQEQIYALRS